MAGISADKLKFTYWIGKNDNMLYGYDTDIRLNISNPEGENKEALTMEMDLQYTLSEINGEQSIEAPQVDEKDFQTLPF